uniref:Sodium:solute symporter n=2 Tax=Macrostomum lignano TaxID=282301 RepID=A0A1I8JJT3_9PLAT
YGISGPFWYAAGGTLQILLFAIISVQLKIRAPGAKTFLQLIQARFDKSTHIVFCVFALITNIIVTAMLMLGGTAVMTNLIQEFSIEVGTIMTCGVIACYTFIGGLGATFYVSYFNTAIIFIIMLIFIMKIYFDPNAMSEENPLGSSDIAYEYLRCALAPEGNYNGSYLTFLSLGGLMFGIINIVGLFGTVFVDQSYWQSSVAAKPKEGVWGFLSGGLVWFAVPFGFATTTGLAYISLSARQGTPLLTPSQVDEGLVPPVIAQRLLGHSGEIMLVTAIVMAITSTGSAEVMAVTSILVYDIYAIYWKPYRSTTDMNTCILCGRQRGRLASVRDKCLCESMTFCQDCERDTQERILCKRAIKPSYQCKMHGAYRTYKEYLNVLKNWGILITIVAIIPLTLILSYMSISLGWLFLFMGVLIGSAVVPVTLALFWTGLTGFGMTFGTLFGTIGGLISWLATASTYPGGLSAGNFIKNSGENIPMLVGNVFSMVMGAIVTFISSLVHRRLRECPPADESIWELTRDVDNPLSPWTELYAA